jgi:hypothetical protein
MLVHKIVTELVRAPYNIVMELRKTVQLSTKKTMTMEPYKRLLTVLETKSPLQVAKNHLFLHLLFLDVINTSALQTSNA